MTTKHPFDAISSLWGEPATGSPDLGTVNLRALTPFQRALLIIDGTVTKFIETYTLESVEIALLAQSEQILAKPHAWLGTQPGCEVGVREVLIEGKYSRTLFAYAASFLVLERLPTEVVARLRSKGEGIGRIMRDLKMESRREVLWYGRERLTDLPESIAGRSDGEFVSRTYRILTGGSPIVLIHEKFPAALADQPA